MRKLLLAFVCMIASASLADGPLQPDADAEASVVGVRAATLNPIDQHVFSRLRELGVTPSPVSSDTEFLRRLSLTTTGQLPTPAGVRAFVADGRPDKRERKIDELLDHDLHAAMWATQFCELTGNSLATIAAADEVKLQLTQMWHDWLRTRFARNMPYDDLVRAIVTATSRNDATVAQWIDDEVTLTRAMREGKETTYAERECLDLFWHRTDIDDEYPVRELAERIASRFMGVRINCARCHDHPFDRWTQNDYLAFVRIFEKVRHDMSPELRAELASRLESRRRSVAKGESPGPPLPRLTEVYLARSVQSADQQPPAPLGGPQLDRDLPDYRVAFVDWLTDPKNDYFARNLANRVWAHYFGRGLVEPLDGLSSSNPAAHPELLDELSARVVASGYDIRQLELLILRSNTWQLSSRPNDTNRNDRLYFSRAYVRMPPAAVVVDMWHSATGIERDFGNDRLHGLNAVEIGSDRLPENRWDPVLSLFGQTGRTETCDCTAKGRPSIRQTLTLMSDPKLVADVARGDLKELLASDRTDDQLIDELFLRTLSRWPTSRERSAALRACTTSDRGEAVEDVLWSLLNTQEFITIH